MFEFFYYLCKINYRNFTSIFLCLWKNYFLAKISLKSLVEQEICRFCRRAPFILCYRYQVDQLVAMNFPQFNESQLFFRAIIYFHEFILTRIGDNLTFYWLKSATTSAQQGVTSNTFPPLHIYLLITNHFNWDFPHLELFFAFPFHCIWKII